MARFAVPDSRLQTTAGLAVPEAPRIQLGGGTVEGDKESLL